MGGLVGTDAFSIEEDPDRLRGGLDFDLASSEGFPHPVAGAGEGDAAGGVDHADDGSVGARAQGLLPRLAAHRDLRLTLLVVPLRVSFDEDASWRRVD